MLFYLFAKGRHFTLKSAPSTSCFGSETRSLQRQQAPGLQGPAGVHLARAEEHPVLAENRDISACAND
jgi:hypothetical protein